LLAALSGKYLSEIGLYLIGINDQWKIKIPWWVAFLSSFIGAYSHVVIDSIMHADLEPFAPLSTTNNLLGIISASLLHKVCIYSGMFGGVLYFVINWLTNQFNISSKHRKKHNYF